MIEISIPDDVVQYAFADALAMPADTGSNFFADFRQCLRQRISTLLLAHGIVVRNMDIVGHRSRQIAEICDITPLNQYSAMYKQTYAIDGAFCFGYGFDEYSLDAINYVCGGKESPSLLPFRTIRGFSIGNIAFNTEAVCDVRIAPDQAFRAVAVAWHNGSRTTPRPFLAFLGVHFDFDRLQPLLDNVIAALPSGFLALDEVQSCSTPVLWISRESGELYTCRCFDGSYTARKEWNVRDKLCCLCTKRTPRAKCGNKMYYTPFQQTWNPYFQIFRVKLSQTQPDRYQKTEDIKTLDRDAENALREFIGHPIIGEKWKEETKLFRLVQNMFAPREVVHHYKGDELLGLEYDIYVPDLRLAVEYHGEQHFKPVASWGGAGGLAKRKDNDKRKRRLSARHAIDLVEFTYADEITPEAVAARLRPFLDRPESFVEMDKLHYAEADRAIAADAERGRERRKERSRTPTLWKSHLEPEQVQLFNALIEWALDKIQAQEDFHVLVLIQCDSGNSMKKFTFDSLEESLREAQRQIAADANIRFYALAFLYSLQEPDEELPQTGVMVATERIGLLSSLFVFCRFQQGAAGTLTLDVPRGCFRTDTPLLPANREYNANALRQMGLGRLIDKPSE
ncbi:MAG: hypothetical protein ACOX9C_05345 [Kiritimatiellia bacterium]|jgi:hypothetical protein